VFASRPRPALLTAGVQPNHRPTWAGLGANGQTVIVRLRFAPSIIGTHYSSHSCVCCGSFGRVCWRSTGSVRGFRSWSRFGSSSCVRCARQRRRTVAHASLQPSRRRSVTAIHRDGVEPAQHNRFRAGAPQHFEQERRNGVRKRLEPFTVRTPFGPDLDYLLSLLAAGAVDPQIGLRGSWDEVSASAQALLDRTVPGKVVLDVQ
jgi:hypothetical protein